MAEVSNQDDYIDLRDVTERYEELENELQDIQDGIGEGDSTTTDLEEWKNSNGAEFEHLKELLGDLKGYGGDHQWRGDWYPGSLIRHDYFVEAMQELVQDIGDLPQNIPGYLVIDWNATAENLRADYASVDFDGVEYWYR